MNRNSCSLKDESRCKMTLIPRLISFKSFTHYRIYTRGYLYERSMKRTRTFSYIELVLNYSLYRFVVILFLRSRNNVNLCRLTTLFFILYAVVRFYSTDLTHIEL